MKYTKAKDNFDRSRIPAAGPNPSIKVPAIQAFNEDNMRMLMSYSDEIPVVNINISMPGGRLPEQSQLNKVGIANLFTAMMEEDTKRHTDQDISIMLDKLGSSISFGSGIDETNVSVRCLKKNLQATLDILEERLLEPKFTQEAFDRLKNQQLESIKNSKTRAATVASTAFNKVVYGNQSLFGIPSGGTLETVPNITLGDIEAYYNQYISRNGLKVVVVGDISADEAKGILTRLKKLPNTSVNLPALPVTNATPNNKTIYVVDIPKAAQTEFRVGYVTNLTYNPTEEYYRCGLMNFPLGGAFNCRINLNLREDKGWTYGARAGFNANKYTGTYLFSSGIKTPATDSALYEVMNEINQFINQGITQEEVTFMKNSIGQSDARKYETGGRKAGFLDNIHIILYFNLPFDYVRDQNKVLDRIQAEELNALAKKWLNPNNMHIVLAGDKKVIAPGLEKMGYTLVELDADGNQK